MRIENYHVAMESAYAHEHIKRSQERLQIVRSTVRQEPVKLEQAKFEIRLSEKDKLKLKLIKAILEKLLGRKVKLLLLELAESENASVQEGSSRNVQFGISYEYSSYEKEHEEVAFSAKGYVETKDGRRIEFEVNFHLSRTLERSEFFRFASGNLQDPLVLKLDEAPLEFSDKKLTLDLDLDGTLDEVSLPKNASLLVFDKNGNNELDDGFELFGPSTGQGFLELSKFDEDKNNWIDESDTIFVKLRVLRKDDMKLVSLLEANVGAIYLSFVKTTFNYYDGVEQIGRLNSSGIYLTEDGQVHTIHQLDLKA